MVVRTVAFMKLIANNLHLIFREVLFCVFIVILI